MRGEGEIGKPGTRGEEETMDIFFSERNFFGEIRHVEEKREGIPPWGPDFREGVLKMRESENDKIESVRVFVCVCIMIFLWVKGKGDI